MSRLFRKFLVPNYFLQSHPFECYHFCFDRGSKLEIDTSFNSTSNKVDFCCQTVFQGKCDQFRSFDVKIGSLSLFAHLSITGLMFGKFLVKTQLAAIFIRTIVYFLGQIHFVLRIFLFDELERIILVNFRF